MTGRIPARAAAIAVVGLLLGGCGIGAAPASIAAPAPSPSPSVSAAIAGTAARISAALGTSGLQLSVPQVAFRPAESPLLAAAPRAIYQVQLPDDQEHGFVVVYEFPDPPAATAAAQEQVAYVQSGPGRVQFPTDAQFVFRQLGSTLVFYDWSPSAATDPRAPDIAAALATVGQGFTIQG
ncbi:MAG TPA: hypothetical protein VFI28_05970 [Candidatus Limnocylindrales bacterium]|nr:hypothetical protein [Candidatus Limnocylindrales bacterium]